MGPIGLQEMIAIFIIALVLFGPKKLPELGRTLGKALSEFRRAKNELKNTFESHMRELERETRAQDSSSSTSSNNYDYSPARYSYPYEDYNRYDPSGDSSHSESAPSTPATEPEPHSDKPAIESAPVADTVARNNGVRPVEPAPAPEEQEHSV